MQFLQHKEDILENLESIKKSLLYALEIGMADDTDYLYNEINDLLEIAFASTTYSQLSEIIVRAKLIEADLDSWFSNQGISTLSLSWPLISPNSDSDERGR